MRCPKCGASGGDGRDECPSCGLIFSKWQPIPSRTSPQRMATPPPPAPSLPIWVPIAAAIVVLFLGIVWTASRRTARAAGQRVDLDAQANAINAAAPKMRIESPVARATNLWPGDLPEEKARGLVERCSGFVGNNVDELPRSFPAELRAAMPILREIEKQGVIELEDGRDGVIWVRLTAAAWEKTRVHDTGKTYVFEHGPRRITSFRLANKSGNTAKVQFDWKFENASVTFGQPSRGNLLLKKSEGEWKVESAVIGEGERRVDLCE